MSTVEELTRRIDALEAHQCSLALA